MTAADQELADAQARVAEAELELNAAQGVVEAWTLRLQSARDALTAIESEPTP